MSGKIASFFREYVFIFSIILTILGCIVLVIGIAGIWFEDALKNIMSLQDDFFKWSLYLLIIGFIIFAIGVYYLYSYLSNSKFVIKEIETKKRSEFLKNHVEIKQKVKHLPSKYHKMLKEKEIELQIK